MHHTTNLKLKSNTEENFTSLDIQYDHQGELAWYRMNAHPRPCFTSELVSEITQWFNEIMNGSNPDHDNLKYIVMASNIPGVFCLGGDLNLFTQLIRSSNREELVKYDTACVDAMYLNHTNLGRDITTISLIQGDALGGGFESALSSDVVIAEKSAKIGLPDILFNLFPGAGAYSFLSRKIGMIEAERMILSGKLYSAEELYKLGAIDILAEDGQGEKAVYDYIKKENRVRNGYRGFRQAKKLTNPITQEELRGTAEIWADTALKLETKDLRMMERLIKRQSALNSSS